MNRGSGFTLIELSIVLLIIGLVAGALFVGRDLIRAAELRKTYSQYQEFSTAINTFKSKYNCLPGDCSNATDFFGAATPQLSFCPPNSAPQGIPTCNGNGNGVIEETPVLPAGVPVFEEQFLMWQHLADAGLIAGSYSGSRLTLSNNFKAAYNCPPILSNAFCWIATAQFAGDPPWKKGNYIYMLSLVQLSAVSWAGFLTAAEAAAYDHKYDDGFPDSGRIYALHSNPFSYFGKGFCTTTDGNGTLVYLSQSTSRDCVLAYYGPGL